MLRTRRLMPMLLVCVMAVPSLCQGYLLEPHFEEWGPPYHDPPAEYHVKWYPQDIPVQYQICDVYSVPGVPDADTAVLAAFDSWEAVNSATITFEFLGYTSSDTDCGYDLGNSRNAVTFEDPDDFLPNGVLGAARMVYDPWCEGTGNDPMETPCDADHDLFFCRMMECDIALNDGVDFIRHGGSPCDAQFDIDAVMAHEIGHMIGLTHARDSASSGSTPPEPQSDPPPGALMFWAIAPCDYTKFPPVADDEAGVSCIYPVEECDEPDFTIAPDPPDTEYCVNSVVTFNPTVNDPGRGIFQYTWDFGDGSPPVVRPLLTSMPHLFTEGGAFTVSCTARWVNDPDNCYWEATYDLSIFKAPTFHYVLMPFVCTGTEIPLQAVLDDPGFGDYVYDLHFGDGEISTGIDPFQPIMHSYPPGQSSFVATLYAEHSTVPDCGSESSTNIEFEIPPEVTIHLGDLTCPGQPQQMWGEITNSGTGHSTYVWEWDFGDGDTQEVTDPENPPVKHTYATEGPFDLYLRATNQDITGCDGGDSTVVTLNTDTPPTFSVVVGETGCAGESVDLWAEVTDPGTGSWDWWWDFGDLTPMEQVSDPTTPVPHVYGAGGPFTAVLHAINQAAPGCEATESGVVTLGADEIPTIPVGNTLMVSREGRDVLLQWAQIDLRYYNVHTTGSKGLLTDDSSGIGSIPPVESPADVEDLRLADLVEEPEEPLYFEVHPRTSCTKTTVFP